jgi:hypothetical protein
MPETTRFQREKQEIENGLTAVQEVVRFRAQMTRVQAESHFMMPGIHGGQEPGGPRLFGKPLGRYQVSGKWFRIWAQYGLDIHGYEVWEKFEKLDYRR